MIAGVKRKDIIDFITAWLFLLFFPISTRFILMVEMNLGPSVSLYDMRGIFCDISVSLIMAFLFVRMAKSVIVKSIVILVWCVIHLGCYEHIKVLHSLPSLENVGYLLDPAFFIGSVLSVSNLRIVLFYLTITGLFVYLARTTLPASVLPKKIIVAVIIIIIIGYITFPISLAIGNWRQDHVIFENLNYLTRQIFPISGREVTNYRKLAEYIPDLHGERFLSATADKKPNVLLLILESVPAMYIKENRKAHGVESHYTMQNLSRLAERYLNYNNFIVQQRQTNRGMYAILCGDYPRIKAGSPKMSDSIDLDIMNCLPKALARNDYQAVYLQAAPLGFMMKDIFMKKIGFQEYLGDAELGTQYYQRSKWGIDDRALLETAADKIAELEQQYRPWFLTVLTVGTHHPYNVPANYMPEGISDEETRAFAYLDLAVGEFFTKLKAMGTLKDTLVIITTDESIGGLNPSFEDSQFMQLARLWGPLIIIAPEDYRGDIDSIHMQADVPLSVLDYLAIPNKGYKFIGRSFFREYERGRRVFFGNAYEKRLGYFDEQKSLLHYCDYSLSTCESINSPPSVPFGEMEIIQSDSNLFSHEDVVNNIEAMIDHTNHIIYRKYRQDDLNVDFSLIDNPNFHIASDRGIYIFFSGQKMKIPAKHQIEISLDVELVGDYGEMNFIHSLVPLDKEPFVRKEQISVGNRLIINYIYQTKILIEELKIIAFAVKQTASKNLTLKFHKANAKITKYEKDYDGDSPANVQVIEERLVHE